jgi:hypothetical protein
MQACTNLKNGKSCGMDGILNETIKYGQQALLPCLEKENKILSNEQIGFRKDPENISFNFATSCV